MPVRFHPCGLFQSLQPNPWLSAEGNGDNCHLEGETSDHALRTQQGDAQEAVVSTSSAEIEHPVTELILCLRLVEEQQNPWR